MKRKFYADPGHGWLAVPLADLTNLGIAGEISHYSYMTSTQAFLEEDRDASIYMNAAKDKGWTVNIDHNHSNNDSKIRTYGNYDPHWVENAIGIGIKVYVPGLNKQATITGENRKQWILDTGHGFPKRNPFRYVKSPDSDPANDAELLKQLNE